MSYSFLSEAFKVQIIFDYDLIKQMILYPCVLVWSINKVISVWSNKDRAHVPLRMMDESKEGNSKLSSCLFK